MFYVKEKGIGIEGMELIDSMAKIEEMLALYAAKKVVTVTVLKKSASWLEGFNLAEGVSEILTEPVVFTVDTAGVNYISSEDEGFVPVAVDISEVVYIGTQQSCNFQYGKCSEDIPVDVISGEDVMSDEEDFYYDRGEYNHEEHNRMVQHELDLVEKLQREKRAREPDAETEEIMEMLSKKKKKRDTVLHYEGDTDVEEFYVAEDDSDSGGEEFVEKDYFEKNKQALRQGPTTNSHHELEDADSDDFKPSSDEDSSPSELGSSDDDGRAKKMKLTCARRRKTKKLKKRQWYDPNRADPQQQFCLKLCFKDVYEFRIALRNFHITQLRDFAYHRNTPSRIIVNCTEQGRAQGCPFALTASTIAHESTFCIRKFRNKHTCIPHGENTKVSINWLAGTSMEAIRTDANTCVDTLIENAKKRYGVEVSRSIAYRARRKAFDAVVGDQEAQYTRLRDYLQAIIDTNPGSRCVVTYKEMFGDPKPNPRFHGLFICLIASKEGFLNGCRPFLGVDGCFIKLSTGQKILAATGRDVNNNIFPIAFGVVDKEDTARWLWFLTQLKYCIGDTGKYGKYTIISDRQKGLLKAISHVFPDSPQRFCLRHIYANFQREGFRGPELKKYMDAASYSYTKNGFDIAMEGLKNDCVEAYNWLAKDST
ncbi:unnamed protein product [Alopecurus aequalis]